MKTTETHCMAGYTKLFNSILYSTIWQEPNETKILWITLLAMSDQYGEVHASIPGLAKMAGITLQECQDALGRLLAPDPFSRTPDNEGRRIEPVEGGWLLLNHAKYRGLMSVEERKEYNRKKQAERRSRIKKDADVSMTVNDKSAMSAHTEADADTKADSKAEEVPPSPPKGGKSIGLDLLGEPIEPPPSEEQSPQKQIISKELADAIWKAFPSRGRENSSKKETLEEIQKIPAKERPTIEEVIKAIEAWKLSPKWTDDGGQYVQGVHRWINKRQWENIPEPAKPKTGSTYADRNPIGQEVIHVQNERIFQ